jgi:hypothetical protein
MIENFGIIIHCLGTLTTSGLVFPDSNDFRNFIQVFYNGLNQLCTLAQETVIDSITVFNGSTMLTNQIMSRIQFNNEINVTLNRFQENTPIEFARTLNLIRTTVQGNALIAVFSTNWKLVVAKNGQGRNASFLSVPITYVDTQQNTSCSCATSQVCTIPAQFFNNSYTPYYTFEGLKLGCYSFETVLRSSLSCFYSAACIYNFRLALPVGYPYMMLYQELTGGIVELNSTSTRFNINDTIETLASEMFIESWTSNVSYERFFNSCAASYCTYKVYYRFDALLLLTTFLSVYVGLSLGIHFMVPYIVKMIQKIRNRLRVVPLQ